MNLGLSQKTVLITGSSRGIGNAIANSFLEEGANVILTSRDVNCLTKLQSQYQKQFPQQSIYMFCGDLSQMDDVLNLFNYLKKKSISLDHVVCNIGSGKSVPPLSEDEFEIQRMLDVNLLATTKICNTLRPLIIENSQKNYSKSITFIGSICGERALGAPIAYSIAKAALNSYSKNLAKALGLYNIRVNIVTPGNVYFIGSTWQKKMAENKEQVNKMLEAIPLRRFASPSEIADSVVYITSIKSSFVTGSNFVIDGGQIL